MAYVDDNLVPGERVRHRARLHGKVYAWAALAAGIAAVALVAAWPRMDDVGRTILAPSLGVVVAALALAAWIRRRSHEFAVTDKRVVIKTGLVQRKTVETLLTKIENIQVQQSVLGRLLGYGTIEITGTGGTTEVFADIGAPLEFRRQVQAATLALEAEQGGAPRDERECPWCAERILVKAKVCRFCGRDVASATSAASTP